MKLSWAFGFCYFCSAALALHVIQNDALTCEDVQISKVFDFEKQLSNLEGFEAELEDIDLHTTCAVEYIQQHDGMNLLKSLAPPKDRKPVMWLHLHNQAGTTIATISKTMGEKALSPHTGNLNYFEKAEDCFNPMNASQKFNLMKKQGATWTAIERTLNPEEFDPKLFMYGVTMSNPQHYVSTRLAHSKGKHVKDEVMAHLKNENEPGEKWCHMLAPGRHWQYYDNFLIRSLLGNSVLFLPPGKINRGHLEAAKKVLDQFELVVPLSDFNTHMSQFVHTFGWNERGILHASSKKHNHHGGGGAWSDEELKYLWDLNALDTELYLYAKESVSPKLLELSKA